jgi:hypothetical protein
MLGAGVVVVVVPWLAAMAAQGALQPMADATLRVALLHQPQYMHVPLPALWPLLPDDLSANVVWGPPAYLLYVKLMLYLPLCVALVGLGAVAHGLSRPDRSRQVVVAVPVVAFSTLSLATLVDRADYYHLRQLLPVALVCLAWLLACLRRWLFDAAPTVSRTVVDALALVPLAAILLVSLGEAARHRDEQAHLLQTPRGSVLVDQVKARDLGALLAALEAEVPPSEAIFVWPAETAIYFLAPRRNPTRFGQLVSTELELLREHDGAVQQEILEALDGAGVRWAVSAPTDNVNGFAFADYAPVLDEALEARFRPVARFGYWTLRRLDSASPR